MIQNLVLCVGTGSLSRDGVDLLTIFVFEVDVVVVVDHVLLGEGLADLGLFALTLAIAVPGTISHLKKSCFL